MSIINVYQIEIGVKCKLQPVRELHLIIPVAFLLCFVLGKGPDGVWSAFWITEIIAAAASIVIYRKAMRQ